MSATGSSGVPPGPSRRFLLVKAALAVLLLGVIVVAAGVGLVAALGRGGDSSTWARWGNVGQTFEAVNSVVSALAVAGILISWQFQSRNMQLAQLALHRSVDAEVRNLHIALTRMAIDDPDLAEVWPSAGHTDPLRRKQQMYANLLIQHAWLQHTAGVATHDEMVKNLRFLFASPIVRAFWRDSANSRNSIYVEGTAERNLAAIADRIAAEYQAVLDCSGETDARSRPGAADQEPAA